MKPDINLAAPNQQKRGFILRPHTPQASSGPWRIQKHDSLKGVFHVDSGPIGYERKTVAIINASQQSEANARLIAAAPELLEWLKWCLDEMDKHELPLSTKPNRTRARAAIAAAQQ